MSERVYLFKRFERFWHWSQAALIIFMLFSGFEIHGSYKAMGFEVHVEEFKAEGDEMVGDAIADDQLERFAEDTQSWRRAMRKAGE